MIYKVNFLTHCQDYVSPSTFCGHKNRFLLFFFSCISITFRVFRLLFEHFDYFSSISITFRVVLFMLHSIFFYVKGHFCARYLSLLSLFSYHFLQTYSVVVCIQCYLCARSATCVRKALVIYVKCYLCPYSIIYVRTVLFRCVQCSFWKCDAFCVRSIYVLTVLFICSKFRFDEYRVVYVHTLLFM